MSSTHLDYPTVEQNYSTDATITLNFETPVRGFAKFFLCSIKEDTGEVSYEITTETGKVYKNIVLAGESDNQVVDGRIEKIVITNSGGATVRYRVGRDNS